MNIFDYPFTLATRLSKWIFFYLLSYNSLLFAQEKKQDIFRNEIGFQSDNDAYMLTFQDKYYTNGLFLIFKSILPEKKLQFLSGKNTEKIIYHFEIGQAIYNPQTAFVRKLDKLDRPFAGWLYGGAGLSFLSNKEQLIKISFQYGVIGNSSYAKEIQTWYHKTFGFDPPVGWQTQLKDQKGFNLKLRFDRKLFRNVNQKTDFALQSNANVGNLFQKIDVGILFRTGKLEKLYQSISTDSRLSNSSNTALQKENFFFLKPSLLFVLRDETIEGKLQGEASQLNFEPNKVRWASEIGFAMARQRWNLDYTLHIAAPEIKRVLWTTYASIRYFYRF